MDASGVLVYPVLPDSLPRDASNNYLTALVPASKLNATFLENDPIFRGLNSAPTLTISMLVIPTIVGAFVGRKSKRGLLGAALGLSVGVIGYEILARTNI
jgi:hypothetical protein